MILPVMLYLALQAVPAVDKPAGNVCGDRDAHTATLRSSAGYKATLSMHSEDDHAKDSHLCRADYRLETARPNAVANPPFQFFSTDDEWNRPLAFRIEGFSRDGADVFVLIAEGDFPGVLEVVEYDMKSPSRLKEISLEEHFTRRLSKACYATLHIVGISAGGLMVLGTSTNAGCTHKRLWELGLNGTDSQKGVVLPEYPKPLLSLKGIVPLERGTQVNPSPKASKD